MWAWLARAGMSFLTGGTLGKLLDTINAKIDNETTRQEIQADVTKTWITAQANLLVGRTWWFQLFFVLPLGFWWTSCIIDSIMIYFPWYHHTTSALPSPLDQWAAYIISALFLIDGGKAIIGRFSK